MKKESGRIDRDWRLCVIVGGEGDPVRTAESALAGGVRVLQYRGKEKTGAVQYREAAALRDVTRRHGADLIINDRPDIVLLVDADGLHVGGEDLPVPLARRVLGPKKLIGATAHSLKEAEQAEREGADYIGFGAVFATNSKEGISVTGLEGLEAVVRQAGVPVLGIGGISPLNIEEVFQCGVTGVAVLSAVSEATDPAAAVRDLLNRIGICNDRVAGAGNGVPFQPVS